MRNIFNGLISKLYTAKARNIEIKDMSIKMSQTEIQRVKRLGKKGKECQRMMGQL